MESTEDGVSMAGMKATSTHSNASLFAWLGVIAFGVRLVQGWVFWGGASRRLFYDWHSAHGVAYAVKMNPNVSGYVANKLMHAMPGSLFPHLIQGIVLHGGFLLAMVWLWTLVELFDGLGLMFGIGTRFWALVSVGLNISLMLIFGWMGSTCVDEWTMAAAGFSMGTLLMLSGGGAYSIDHWIANKFPNLGNKMWYRLLFSGELPFEATKKWGLWLGILSLLFTAGFYQYLHGAVTTPLHARVTFHHHKLSITDTSAASNGSVRFHAYVDAGPDTGKLYIIEAELVNGSGSVVEKWNGTQLSKLPKESIQNMFTKPWMSKFSHTMYGIGGVTGAKATISLPGEASVSPGTYTLRLISIDGKKWQKSVSVS